jgi:diguanylate cyclase (GGDEF)-like protein
VTSWNRRTRMKKISTAVLSGDPLVRQQIVIMLSSLSVYAISWLVLALGVQHGDIVKGQALGLVVAECAVLLAFYVLLRTGWSQRFRDHSLTLPQMVAGLTFTNAAYLITGPLHAGMPLLLLLILLYGMFNLGTLEVLAAGLYAIIGLAVASAWATATHPETHPPFASWILFAFTATVLPAVSFLAATFSRLRARLKSQKADLALALERIHEQATRDELTSLINRRHAREIIDFHSRRFERSGTVFAVAMLDIDHFKAVNDSYGHQVGDEVLRAFAQKCLGVIRESDLLARWGGEEFLMLFAETSAASAVSALERLRRSLDAVGISASVPDLRVTFSAGAADYRRGQSIEDIVACADVALYAAKAAGRNRTIVA